MAGETRFPEEPRCSFQPQCGAESQTGFRKKGKGKNTCNKLQNKTPIPRSRREGREGGWGLRGAVVAGEEQLSGAWGQCRVTAGLLRPSGDGVGSLNQGSGAIPGVLSSPYCPSPQIPGLQKSPVIPLTSGRIHSSPRQTLGLLVLSFLEWNCLTWLCSFLLYNEVDQLKVYTYLGFPGGASGKEPTCQQCRRCGFDPWVGKISWRRAWQPTPVFLPGESHGQRSLAGCSSWHLKELDTTKATSRAWSSWTSLPLLHHPTHLSHHRAWSLAPQFYRSPDFCKPFYTDPRIASKVELRFILLQFKHSPSTPLARTPQKREWMRGGGVLTFSVSISYNVTFFLPCLHWLADLGQVI